MRKKKSLPEILASPYVSRSEIQTMLHESRATAKRVYDMALAKDRAEMADRLVYPNGEKVRMSSVDWAIGNKKSRNA